MKPGTTLKILPALLGGLTVWNIQAGTLNPELDAAIAGRGGTLIGL